MNDPLLHCTGGTPDLGMRTAAFRLAKEKWEAMSTTTVTSRRANLIHRDREQPTTECSGVHVGIKKTIDPARDSCEYLLHNIACILLAQGTPPAPMKYQRGIKGGESLPCNRITVRHELQQRSRRHA